tara:strand:+ start:76 stop:1158 length:1083 start_codon:yes stop_codon:yes gene_type:complete
MSLILSEIVSFFFLIFLGVLLQKKFDKPSRKNGLKDYILNIALPTTVFVSLLSINVQKEYWLYPLVGIIFDVAILICSPFLIKISGLSSSRKKNTLFLLLPSFAPGLSCFPIINEFLGNEALAKASILDFGNKLFVLLFLFLVAFQLHKNKIQPYGKISKKPLKTIFKNVIREPINIALFLAFSLIFLEYNYENLPNLLISLTDKIKNTLTPIVLIFIGLSLVINKKSIAEIIPILFLRAGLSLFLVNSILLVFGRHSTNDSILYFILALSSASFWPISHMTFINALEKNLGLKNNTFDIKFALKFLAYSLPFSTITILILMTKDEFLRNTNYLFLISLLFILFGVSIKKYFFILNNKEI